MPGRTTNFGREAFASVKCGTNMIEITLTNTDIKPERRGQTNNWIFTHAKGVRTTPLVFGKTVLVDEHPPAPFCLSVAAPFWVSIHQEQIDANGGERFRESVEVRSCNGSEMPCYEMTPLANDAHPLFNEHIYLGKGEMTPLANDAHSLFNEHIYLGKGVIRVDRSVEIPPERTLRAFFSNNVSTTLQRQYRVQLPWRQIEGQPESSIPRARQITDIHTIVRSNPFIQDKPNERSAREEESIDAGSASHLERLLANTSRKTALQDELQEYRQSKLLQAAQGKRKEREV
ncbi:unnamed protein product [Strongylus vulgaris]|uniref:Uncharacterized protein n=1 Tax=Strongylus vulgaris TaxID=40348 RepID=A0A3P7J2X1_STRVU|nr:unnamed protein product [Strongylus vulgaris]